MPERVGAERPLNRLSGPDVRSRTGGRTLGFAGGRRTTGPVRRLKFLAWESILHQMTAAPLELPPLRVLARHALPRVIEGAVIPTVLFLTLLHFGGQVWAIGGALVWSALVIGTRLGFGRPVPTIVLVGLGALGLRTVLALAGKPLILRLARDFCPLPEDVMAHGHLRRFFLGISVLWGVVQLINAGLTLYLLLSQSLGTFVLMRTTLTTTLTVGAIAISVLWFQRIARRAPAPVPALALSA